VVRYRGIERLVQVTSRLVLDLFLDLFQRFSFDDSSINRSFPSRSARRALEQGAHGGAYDNSHLFYVGGV